jgi:hypothetical protein
MMTVFWRQRLEEIADIGRWSMEVVEEALANRSAVSIPRASRRVIFRRV